MAPSIPPIHPPAARRDHDGQTDRETSKEEWVRYLPFIIRQSNPRFWIFCVCVDEVAPAFFFLIPPAMVVLV